KEALRSPGSDDPLNAVVALLGRAVARDLVRVGPIGSERLRVSGFCSLPTLSRGTREHHLFFVNGRPVRSPLVYRAIDDAYRSRPPPPPPPPPPRPPCRRPPLPGDRPRRRGRQRPSLQDRGPLPRRTGDPRPDPPRPGRRPGRRRQRRPSRQHAPSRPRLGRS